MPIKPNNQTAKHCERMVDVLGQRARAVSCKIAQSGATALVQAGFAHWVDRGTAIRLCENWPSEAA
jgi:hypothetical protein